jgi:glyoxylase-like metal-dependent hydrolase (beta-lactamase superfamily II)
MILKQLFDQDTWTYTYLIGDESTGKAALIDPVAEKVDRDLQLAEELGLRVTQVLDTHVHADHVTAAGEIRKRTGAKTAVGSESAVECADTALNDGDKLALGRLEIEARSTPGHTSGCKSYVVRDGARTLAFTGDALLIRGSGRTDFQGGDAATLFKSVREQLFTLPDNTEVYPGHDYRGNIASTIGEEKQHNPRLKLENTETDFVRIMGELKLPNPRLMDVAVPANLGCGLKSTG